MLVLITEYDEDTVSLDRVEVWRKTIFSNSRIYHHLFYLFLFFSFFHPITHSRIFQNKLTKNTFFMILNKNGVEFYLGKHENADICYINRDNNH